MPKPAKVLKSEIIVPEDVTATLEGAMVTLKGKKGELKRAPNSPNIKVSHAEGKIILEANSFSQNNKKALKTFAAHLKNMLKGVVEGHRYKLIICSGHFPITVTASSEEVVVKNFIGEKVPRVLKIKKGATVKINGTEIIVESTSLETAGQVSGDLEQLTRRTRFDTRVFQDGIYITDKDGKEMH